jgi:hypothetical protein
VGFHRFLKQSGFMGKGPTDDQTPMPNPELSLRFGGLADSEGDLLSTALRLLPSMPLLDVLGEGDKT